MIIDDEHLDFIFKNLYVTDIKNIEPIRKCINSNLSSATAEFVLKLLAKKTIWKPLFHRVNSSKKRLKIAFIAISIFSFVFLTSILYF